MSKSLYGRRFSEPSHVHTCKKSQEFLKNLTAKSSKELLNLQPKKSKFDEGFTQKINRLKSEILIG